MTALGTRLFGDDVGSNRAIVEQVRASAATRTDGIPFLLLPVRIETRFARADVPVDNLGASQLVQLLQSAVTAAEALSTRTYTTQLPTATVARRQFKRDVEDPLIAAATADLDAIGGILVAVSAQLRRSDAADLAAATTATALAARLSELLGTAGTGIRTLRSSFLRDPLVARLPDLSAQLSGLQDSLTNRAEPAAQLLAALRLPASVGGAGAAADRPVAPDGGIPRHRLVDSAAAYQAAGGELDNLQRIAKRLSSAAADPIAFHRRYAEVGLGARLQRVLEHISSIALLPQAWQQQLSDRVTAVHADLTAALSPVQVTQPERLLDLLARLPGAVAGLRTDAQLAGATALSPGVSTPAAAMQTVDELRVRIFPDDVAVLTHEEGLTAAESAAGGAYWQDSTAAGGDEAARRAAWRVLAARHGPHRAAWIVRQTAPSTTALTADATIGVAVVALDTVRKRLDEASVNPAGRVGSVIRALDDAGAAVHQLSTMAPAGAARLRELTATIEGKLSWLGLAAPGPDTEAAAARFADLVAALGAVPVAAPASAPQAMVAPPARASAWTAQPRAVGLPERFVVVTVSGTEVTHVVAGAPIADTGVALAPDPAATDDDAFTVNPDGTITVGESMRWLVEYDTAVSAGMAVSVRITAAEAQQGFHRVYVLGIAAGTETVDQQTLQQLLINHHYTERGLALLAVGTPTNSTEQPGAAGTAYSSAEDAEHSFDVELGGELASPSSGTAAPSDGARLAGALGIPVETLDHIERADAQDITEAAVATAALWPGTAGYAIEELLGSVIGIDAQDRLRGFVTANVTGRGPLPTLRIGPQPYGVLATTAFTRFIPDGGTAPPADTPGMSEADRQHRFDILLRDVLLLMHADWTAARQTAQIPHAYSDGVTDPQTHLLAMLGLDATSVGYGQRFAVNAGKRGTGVGPVHTNDPLSLTSGPFALLNRFVTVLSEANSIPVSSLTDKGLVAAAYRGIYDALDSSRGFEVRYLDRAVALPGLIVTDDIGARLTGLLQKSLETLGRDAATPSADQPLLALILRQALLVQARDAAARILEREGVVSPALRSRIGAGDLFAISRIGFRKDVTRWSFLLQDLSVLREALGAGWVPAGGALYGYLNQQGKRMDDFLTARADNGLANGYAGIGAHQSEVDALRAHAAAVSQLASIPGDRLAEATQEHLDLCSHRLDAWILGLATRRLNGMRATTPQGVHLGAFGWVEDLKPGPQVIASTDVPPILDTDPGTIVRHDGANEGFVHAPSLGHAAAAAILRAGYLAHGGDAAGGRMAVNVSSRRVRNALQLIDGVGAGNDLGALLGYQFERDLHDAFETSGIVLDDLIVPLRQRFPTAVPVSAPGGATVTTADEDLRQVVDGYALFTVVQDWLQLHGGAPAGTLLAAMRADNYAAYPFGLAGLIPALAEGARLDAVLAAIDRLADTVDALGDLVVTEGIFQLVQGNQARAAAVLSALGTGRVPPTPEVVDTPVAGARVSHRVLVQLPIRTGQPGTGLPAGWPTPTARSAAEPTLNQWLGDLLGPAGMTWARVETDDGGPPRDVTLASLDLQPIDLLAILHHGLQDGLTELSVRVLDTLRPLDVREGEPAPALTLTLNRDPAWPSEVRSLADSAALLESIGAAVSHGRAATSADFVLVDSATSAGAPPDTDELGQRIDAGMTALRGVGVDLLRLLSDGVDGDPALLDTDIALYVADHAQTYRGGAAPGEHMIRLDALWLRRDQFRSALLAAMGFAIPGVAMPTEWSTRDAVGLELLEAAEAALVEVAGRLRSVTTYLAEQDAGDVAGAVHALALLFTETLPVLPQFRLSNAAELTSALADLPTTEPELAVQRWLSGVMAVREPVAAFGTALSLAGAFGTSVADGVPVQLPARAGEPWLGEAGPTGPGDRLSLVIYRSKELPLDGSAGVALLVDQWTEILPAAELTTGVSFHYDQPDSQPPQTMLLAVPPEQRGTGWLWEDLLQTLDDTLELAKNRAVEPMHLQDSVYGPLLPALIGDIPPGGPGGGLSDHRVVLDFGSMQSGGA